MNTDIVAELYNENAQLKLENEELKIHIKNYTKKL